MSDTLLLLKYRTELPRAVEIEAHINDSIQKSEQFIINTKTWQERQFIHILAREKGWYSKKTSQVINANNAYVCENCHVFWKFPTYIIDVCCMNCDGTCPNCGKCKMASGDISVFTGDVIISPTPLKQGRKTRRRINRWRNGKIKYDDIPPTNDIVMRNFSDDDD
jgi:hypothetical protein